MTNFDLAIISSDTRTAYVSELGKPETTITVSARTSAELVALLWNRYRLVPSSKPGVYRDPANA